MSSAASRKRQKIFEEIIETEEEYVNNLEILSVVYEKPLQEKGEEVGCSKSLHIKVFNDLGPIRKLFLSVFGVCELESLFRIYNFLK